LVYNYEAVQRQNMNITPRAKILALTGMYNMDMLSGWKQRKNETETTYSFQQHTDSKVWHKGLSSISLAQLVFVYVRCVCAVLRYNCNKVL